MTCRQCGTDIAERALICYRCGTPTAPPRDGTARPVDRRRLVGFVALTVVVVLLAALAWQTIRDPGSSPRMLAYVGLAMVAFLALGLAARRSRRRL